MHRSVISDPFTGLDLQAVEYANGNLQVETPWGKPLAMVFDPVAHTFTIDASAFRHRETCTLAQAAQILGVSRMRVSCMCSTGILTAAKINGVMVIDYDSVMKERNKSHDRHSLALASVTPDR